MAKAPKSPGEKAMAAYLNDRALPHQYEAAVGPKHPDFSVEHPQAGKVVCEVYEPRFRLPRGADGRPTGGFIDPYHVVRKGIDKRAKSEQARATLEAGHPFVIVLASTDSEWPVDDDNIPGALFGDVQVVMPFDGQQADVSAARLAFGDHGRLESDRNQAYSAVAAISSFNPGYAAVEARALERLLAKDGPGKHIGLLLEAGHELAQAGCYDEAALTRRLRIFHNPYAAIPLPMTFAGPHDDQWAADHIDGTYGEVSWGVLSSSVRR